MIKSEDSKFSVKNNNSSGSITVEASLVLPFFICVIFSIAFLIRVIYTYEIVQHAISNTAYEMSVSGYIYHISGIQGIHDAARDEMDSRAKIFRDHLSSFFYAYEGLNSFSNVSEDGFEYIEDSITNIENIYNSLKDLADGVSEVFNNPLEEFKSIAFYAASGAFEDIKTEFCIPITKLYMRKYLINNTSNVDKRLKDLNIKGGLKGFDFSDSRFFEDENNEIDIIVKYEMLLPVPIKVFPKLLIVQRATSKAWLSGNNSIKNRVDNIEDDIWNLGNFQRGRTIRKIIGANLPDTFPVIANFSSGTATMIKSMDTTAATYQNADGIVQKLSDDINRLAEYKGQEEPWGKNEIVIKQNEIMGKKLILVIPTNNISIDQENAIETCKIAANAKGITLEIIRYGTKKVIDNMNNSMESNEEQILEEGDP